MGLWTGMTRAMCATTQMTAAGTTTNPSQASAAGTASSWQKPFKGLCHCPKPSKSWRSLIRSLTGIQSAEEQHQAKCSQAFMAVSGSCVAQVRQMLKPCPPCRVLFDSHEQRLMWICSTIPTAVCSHFTRLYFCKFSWWMCAFACQSCIGCASCQTASNS